MPTTIFSQWNLRFVRFQFRYLETDQRRRLWIKLSKLLDNGVQLTSALDSIRSRMKKNSPGTFAVSAWIRDIDRGLRLHEAVADWVTDEEAMLLAAGEKSGIMTDSLMSMTEILAAKREIRRAIIGGTAYPIILFSLAILILYLFGCYLVPIFTKVAPVERLYGLPRFMISLSGFIQDWIVVFCCGVVLATIAFFFSLPRFDGRIRILLDQHVPYSIYRMVLGSSWLIAIAALIKAGLKNDTALQQLEKKANPWLKTRIRACLVKMRNGYNMGDALRLSGYEFPDPEINADLGVLAQHAGFTEALEMTGQEWIQESVIQIKSRMKILQSAGIVCVAILVIFMVSGLVAMQMQLGEFMQTGIR